MVNDHVNLNGLTIYRHLETRQANNEKHRRPNARKENTRKPQQISTPNKGYLKYKNRKKTDLKNDQNLKTEKPKRLPPYIRVNISFLLTHSQITAAPKSVYKRVIHIFGYLTVKKSEI